MPSISITGETSALAARLNPETRILARVRFLSSEPYLKQTGVAGIAFEEEEVAKSLTSLLLDDLEKQKLLAAASEIAAQESDEK